MQPYTELQQYRYRWYCLCFFALCQEASLIFLLTDSSELFHGIFMFLGPLIWFFPLVSLGYWIPFQQLTLRIDETGVHYQTPLAWAKWQHIPWSAIDRLYVREVALIGEYPKGVLGMRQGPNGFAYVPMMGLFGLQIEKTTGGKYLLGTQQPDLLSAYLLNREAANPVSAA